MMIEIIYRVKHSFIDIFLITCTLKRNLAFLVIKIAVEFLAYIPRFQEKTMFQERLCLSKMLMTKRDYIYIYIIRLFYLPPSPIKIRNKIRSRDLRI